MASSVKDVKEGIWQTTAIKGWETINKNHLKLISSHWLESQRATTAADSGLQYRPHKFIDLTFDKYICIATVGGANAKKDLRFLYQFKRTILDDAYVLHAAGRCAGHNYDNPKWLEFPKDTYRIPDPKDMSAEASTSTASTFVVTQEPQPVVIPPLAERTLAQKIKYGFT